MTIDGISAFDVVPGPLRLWEIFNKGEEGKIWQFTNYNYQNTTCRVKMNGKLSRTFEETLGVGQGKSRASDHYKVFNQPLLTISRMPNWESGVETYVSVSTE